MALAAERPWLCAQAVAHGRKWPRGYARRTGQRYYCQDPVHIGCSSGNTRLFECQKCVLAGAELTAWRLSETHDWLTAAAPHSAVSQPHVYSAALRSISAMTTSNVTILCDFLVGSRYRNVFIIEQPHEVIRKPFRAFNSRTTTPLKMALDYAADLVPTKIQ